MKIKYNRIFFKSQGILHSKDNKDAFHEFISVIYLKMYMIIGSWHKIYYPVSCSQKVRKSTSVVAHVIFFWSLQIRTELIYLLPSSQSGVRTCFQTAMRRARKDTLLIKIFSPWEVLCVIQQYRLSRAAICK